MEDLQAWVAGDLKTITAIAEEDAAALLAAFTEASQGEPSLAAQTAAAAAEPFQVCPATERMKMQSARK